MCCLEPCPPAHKRAQSCIVYKTGTDFLQSSLLKIIAHGYNAERSLIGQLCEQASITEASIIDRSLNGGAKNGTVVKLNEYQKKLAWDFSGRFFMTGCINYVKMILYYVQCPLLRCSNIGRLEKEIVALIGTNNIRKSN